MIVWLLIACDLIVGEHRRPGLSLRVRTRVTDWSALRLRWATDWNPGRAACAWRVGCWYFLAFWRFGHVQNTGSSLAVAVVCFGCLQASAILVLTFVDAFLVGGGRYTLLVHFVVCVQHMSL